MRKLFYINIVVLSLLAILGIAVISSANAQGVNANIQRAQSYLQNLSTAKAEFYQRAHDGSQLSGTFYLDRPGKLRFEYNEIKDFIVADGIFIYFYDAELGEQTNAPIGQTMADFLLRKNISFQEDLKISNAGNENGFITMTLQDKDDQGAGSVKLFFKEQPFELQKWQVTDAAGLTTEIYLRNLQRDLKLPSRLFAYFDPKEDKPSYNQ